MKNRQAWAWLTAGVLALGLNGMYQDGGGQWAHRTVTRIVERTAERTEPVLALATGRADRFLAQSNMLAARSETASCRRATEVSRFQTYAARAQSASASFQDMSARGEAALARIEADRARLQAQVTRVRVVPAAFNSVVCPRVRVSTPR